MDLISRLPAPLRPLLPALTALGALTATTLTYRLLRHVYTYALHPSGLSRYARPNAYALITGASDGIGRGYARALAANGFNLILHGRNRSKLSTVRDSILSSHPGLKVHLLVIDATDSSTLQSNIDTQVSALLPALDGPLSILINNAGGSGAQSRPYAPLEELSSSDISAMIDLNARFPMQLTRALMPTLLANQPALLLNISSFASINPVSWLPVYAATKGFGEKWSVSMARTLRAQGHDVEALCFVVGQVCGTTHNDDERSLVLPTADDFARGTLKRVGCGEEVIVPWWPHALQVFVVGLLPKVMVLGMMNRAIGKLKAIDERLRKER